MKDLYNSILVTSRFGLLHSQHHRLKFYSSVSVVLGYLYLYLDNPSKYYIEHSTLIISHLEERDSRATSTFL